MAAALTGYLIWAVVRVRRVLRHVEQLRDEHARLIRFAHRHDTQAGRVIPVRFGKGLHRDH